MDNFQRRFSAKRIKWSNDELVITLGYYIFIYVHNTSKKNYSLFTDNLRAMTGNDRSYGSVGMRFSNFNSVDPKYDTGFAGGDPVCKPLWHKYIGVNREPSDELIEIFYKFISKYGQNNIDIYKPFLKKYDLKVSSKLIDRDDVEKVISSNDIFIITKMFGNYDIVSRPDIDNPSAMTYKRDYFMSKKAILLSNFKCNIDESHDTFLNKNNMPYMEAHHLIPFSAQKDYFYSLDIDANIICLCPNCHRKIHYGIDNLEEIKKLYAQRIDLLKKSGINISLDELLKYYK